MTDREKIYDERISPLMKEVIALCKEHDIPLLCNFGLGHDESDDYGRYKRCTTFIPGSDGSEAPESFHEAFQVFNRKPEVNTTTIVERGS